ncbi:MAG TPA: c-type cytochrome [Polyangiaceae bacterium]|nr:c-type cytochrome [Polyangiaceae bacterium]
MFGFARKRISQAIALLGAIVTACGATQFGATPANLAQARTVTARGADLFAKECAECHGDRGEGLAQAPAVLGPGALPIYPRDSAGAGSLAINDSEQLRIRQQTRPAGAPWRDPFRTAQDLFEFLKTHPAKKRAEWVAPDDYWAVATFMLAAHGSAVPAAGINADNASSVAIQPP